MGTEVAASNPFMWIGLIVALFLMIVGIAYSRKAKKEKQAKLDKKQEELDKRKNDGRDLKP